MKPKGKRINLKSAHPEHAERYDTYEHWGFLGYSGFTSIPIREWLWCPRYVWTDWVRGFWWLWFHVQWNKTYTYVERPEWIQSQLQKKMNTITNMQLDNIRLSRRN